MHSYQQSCPVARGAEVFAERWTPMIMRNILYGCHGFNEIAAGAPGLSRSLLTKRHAELERAGVNRDHPEGKRPRISTGGLTVTGPSALPKALPTWNRRPAIGQRLHSARGNDRLTANLVYRLEDG